VSDGLGVVALAAAVCAAVPYRRCLFDFRELQASLTFKDHLQLGNFVGDSLYSLEKVASVVMSAMRAETSEMAAQRTGARVRTFTDIDDAKAWIGT